MKIYGVVLPEGVQDPRNIADEFTPSEVQHIGLSGLPIWVDHKDGSSVGEIVHDWVGADGLKYVAANIRGNSKEESLTQARIRNGALQDFSLTHRFDLLQHVHTREMAQRKTPIEVSVCRKGRREKCHILGFTEDSLEGGKTSDLYNNRHDQTGIPSNPFRREQTLIMSASVTSQPETVVSNSPATPMDVSSIQPARQQTMPNDTQLLEEVVALKQQQQMWMQERAKFETERQTAIQETERIRQEQHQQTFKDLDAVINVLLETTGTPNSEKVSQALEPLKNCRDTGAIGAFKNILSDCVKANQDNNQRIAQLNQTVEALRKGHLVSQYTALSSTQEGNRFSLPESRFAQPPAVKVPFSIPAHTPGLFYNPQNGSVTSPVQAVPQQSVAPPQFSQPPVSTGPVLHNWSHNQYPSGGMGFGGFQPRQTFEVKANSSNMAPGAASQYFTENGGFLLESMIAYGKSNSQESQTRQDVFGAYDSLVSGVLDQSKRLQNGQ
jgi:hypothetical protein